MKKYIYILSLPIYFLFSFSTFAENNFYIKLNSDLTKNVQFKKNNPNLPLIKDVCKVQLTSLKAIPYSGAAAFNKLSLYSESGKFDFGNLLTTVPSYSVFNNATIKTGSNYYNLAYVPSNAIDGYEANPNMYWLANTGEIATYTITLQNPINLNKISIADRTASGRGLDIPYTINLYDCSNIIINSKQVTERISSELGLVGDITF